MRDTTNKVLCPFGDISRVWSYQGGLKWFKVKIIIKGKEDLLCFDHHITSLRPSLTWAGNFTINILIILWFPHLMKVQKKEYHFPLQSQVLFIVGWLITPWRLSHFILYLKCMIRIQLNLYCENGNAS